MASHRILVVDDEREIRELLVDALTSSGYEATAAPDGRAALELVTRRLFDVALVDVSMPGMDGLELLRELKGRDAGLDVVMMTGHPTVGTAVGALRAGAYDYLAKPLDLEELQHLLGRVTERRQLRREVTALRTRLGEQLQAKELIGISPTMQEVRGFVEEVAGTDSSVLIEGETGTGKELVAASMHHRSPRAKGPFIPVNCGAIPADLMESEFFGHVRGAFSGAVADALGLLRSAHTGTLFLDEVADLPAALQVKLLRVLQDRTVRPVGSTRTHAVDIRVIAASNRSLADAVREGAFRQDLFYRLDVVRIVVPPLRARREDIPLLVTHFMRQLNERFGRHVTRVSPGAMAALMAYDFPGNVRELENLLERAYALGARDEITERSLPSLQPDAASLPAGGSELPTLAQAERELILRALRQHDNDRERAARALGLSRRTLHRRLKDYGL